MGQISRFQFGAGSQVVATTGTASSVVQAWEWGDGFGRKFADPIDFPNSNSSTPFSFSDTIRFNSSGTQVLAAADFSPRIIAYNWNRGFSSRISGPTTSINSDTIAIDFTPGDTAVILGVEGTPYIVAYGWSASGFGTKFANPASLLPGYADGVSVHPVGNVIVAAHAVTPFITAYAWSSGFGAKFSNPATLPAGTGVSVDFSPSGADIVVSHLITPFIAAYPWSSGFGSKYADPVSLPAEGADHVEFSSTGNFLAGATSTPIIYAWSSGFGSKVADPFVNFVQNCNAVRWHPSETAIFFGSASSPYLQAFRFSNSGYGAEYSSPAVKSTTMIQGIDIMTSLV